MKRLSRMAALGLALALTFGMTVNAETKSPTTEGVSPEMSEEQINNYTAEADRQEQKIGEVTVVVNGQTVKLEKEPVAPETLLQAEQIADGKAAAAAADLKISVPAGKKLTTQVVGAADISGITIPEGESVELTIPINGISKDGKYILLHLANGKWETIIPTSVADGQVTARFTSLSPVIASQLIMVSVEETGEDESDDSDNSDAQTQAAAANPATSPKTAETLPVAGVMALIALAGAAVCANKIRYNK